jgi:hypothetical protein
MLNDKGAQKTHNITPALSCLGEGANCRVCWVCSPLLDRRGVRGEVVNYEFFKKNIFSSLFFNNNTVL